MTLTGFTKVSDRFTVGAAAVPPTAAALDADDGHEYWQTSDGTVNGTVLAVWRYEGTADIWMQQPLGGTPCPAPMTRLALIGLRNAGQLRTECHYTITDHVQNRLVAGTTITLHAVAANELSERVEVDREDPGVPEEVEVEALGCREVVGGQQGSGEHRPQRQV